MDNSTADETVVTTSAMIMDIVTYKDPFTLGENNDLFQTFSTASQLEVRLNVRFNVKCNFILSIETSLLTLPDII